MTTLADSEEFREFMRKHVARDTSDAIFLTFKHEQTSAPATPLISDDVFELMDRLPEPRYENWKKFMLRRCAESGKGLTETARWFGKSLKWVADNCKEYNIKLADGRIKTGG